MKQVLTGFCLLLLASNVFSAQPNSSQQQEIQQLLETIRSSSCQFNRNGTWYKGAEAVRHIEKKYQYFLEKDKISSSEDFIKFAATKSELSGKVYQIKCSDGATQETATWLMSQLQKYRAVK